MRVTAVVAAAATAAAAAAAAEFEDHAFKSTALGGDEKLKVLDHEGAGDGSVM